MHEEDMQTPTKHLKNEYRFLVGAYKSEPLTMKSVPTPPSSIRLQSLFRNDTRISYLLTHINFQRIKLQHRKSNKIIRCTCCRYTERSVNT